MQLVGIQIYKLIELLVHRDDFIQKLLSYFCSDRIDTRPTEESLVGPSADTTVAPGFVMRIGRACGN